MPAPAIDIGFAQRFNWHASPDDFEDSPRGALLVPAFEDVNTSPSKNSFCTIGCEYPLATSTAPQQLPSLLTSFARTSALKPQPQPCVVHDAHPPVSESIAQRPGLIPQPETCLLATGLSRMGDISKVDASHHFAPPMQIPHCPATMIPMQMSTVCFGDFGVSDLGAELWQEQVPLEAEIITSRKPMCDYCCVRKAMCFSDCDGNPEMYCDVCQFDGDQRWRENRAKASMHCGDDKLNAISQRSDLNSIPPVVDPVGTCEASCQTESKVVQDSEPRKKGRSKKPASKKAPERQAKDPTPNPVAPSDWEDGTTTVMMRNIPSRYTVEELVSELITMNFKDRFDYLYLPMDFKTKRNKGYAFINFASPQHAIQFHADFHGVQLPKYGAQKTLHIARAETQGLEANLNAAQRDKPRITNPWFRPMVFNVKP